MNPDKYSHIVVLAGPNGAGKSTIGPKLVRDTLNIDEFVNADTIAQGISSFHPESVAIQAGKIMVKRMRELAEKKRDFAFETTLASRYMVNWIKVLKMRNYKICLFFLWLPSADIAVERVRRRIISGGHLVPEEVICRRYRLGLYNFFNIYRPITDNWRIFDNTRFTGSELIAEGIGKSRLSLKNVELWQQIIESAKNER